MKDFVEKLIERLEKEYEYQLKKADECEKKEAFEMISVSKSRRKNAQCFDAAIQVVKQLAEEYKQNIDQDLMIVESLPSLYPMMQPFEVEAVYKVVECAKYNNESVNGDLISKSAIIKELNGIYLDNLYDDKEDILEKAIGIVDHFPTAYNGGWIPCSERLPKSGVTVIVSYKDRFLAQADETCEGWYDATNMIWHLTDYEYSDNVEVIAWRERLAPYQPKGE